MLNVATISQRASKGQKQAGYANKQTNCRPKVCHHLPGRQVAHGEKRNRPRSHFTRIRITTFRPVLPFHSAPPWPLKTTTKPTLLWHSSSLVALSSPLVVGGRRSHRMEGLLSSSLFSASPSAHQRVAFHLGEPKNKKKEAIAPGWTRRWIACNKL